MTGSGDAAVRTLMAQPQSADAIIAANAKAVHGLHRRRGSRFAMFDCHERPAGAQCPIMCGVPYRVRRRGGLTEAALGEFRPRRQALSMFPTAGS